MKVTALLLCLLGVLPASPAGARAEAAGPAAGPAAWPLQPAPPVVRRFDPPDSPWGAGHRGVDLLGRAGQEVHAALAGTVTFAGTLAGRGVVVVDHGGTRTTYEPVEPSVAGGVAVGTDEVIGHLQAGSSHCFPQACLHWGLLRGEQYLDPLSLLGRAPVRLLPLAGPPTVPVPVPARVRPVPPVPPWMLTPAGAPAGRPFAVALP